MNNLIKAFFLIMLGQIIIWVQSNGQFIWPWWKNNPILVSFTLGGVASYIFIKATYFSYIYFNDLIWPGKFLSFGVGILVFTILTHFLMKEGINLKTIVSLGLAISLILVQLFWK
jgi:hypothetical protein